ncbi:hypothetical protein ZIOFF_070416 [Zingiber officinale]|uniref:Beta-carotene isomerase D27-like C-terminal domain-containing protein n=1 Tax=Zingiber officinale TaxID=94328 RepID=A0A8J5CEL2_ZINOF|nr:hypothetical protein ZIOFF_070416 [Zingiber officinale]
MPITSQCTFRRRYTQIQVQISPSSDIKHSKQCVEGQQRKQSDCREGRDAEDTTLGIEEEEECPVDLSTETNDWVQVRKLMHHIAMDLLWVIGPTGMEKFASGGAEKKQRAFWDMDYENFVDVSKRVMTGRSRKQQLEVVREVLLSMLPPGAPAQFRKLFPPTRWAAEFNAALTVPFFYWLVGPSEVIEVEVNGVKQRSGVLIKKCRYLENSGCVGMCVNMCKLPTQDFFTNDFGLPLTMNPNFEDMSCEMVYGQVPPPIEEDAASKQPCYADICSMASFSSPSCPKLQ